MHIKNKSGPRTIWNDEKNILILKKEYPKLGAVRLLKKYNWNVTAHNINNKACLLKIKRDKISLSEELSERIVSLETRKKLSLKRIKNNVEYLKNDIIDDYINKNLTISCLSKKYNTTLYIIKKTLLDNNIKLKIIKVKDRFNEKEKKFLEINYFDSSKNFILENLKDKKWSEICSYCQKLNIKRNLKKFRSLGTIKFNKENNPMKNPTIVEKSKRNSKLALLKNPEKIGNNSLRRNKPTSIELRVKRILDKHKIKYLYNKYIKTKISYRFPDFRINYLIIECDGIRFHNIISDTIRDNELIDCGYTILHFNEIEINKNIEEVEKCILKKLKELNLLEKEIPMM